MVSSQVFILATLAGVGHAQFAQHGWISPPYEWMFQFPLPLPPVKGRILTVENPVSGKPIDYYQIDIRPFEQQVYPDRAPADLIGYDGMSPGPLFIMERGREAVVRFVNHHDRNATVHLHGSPTRAPWDGWAEDMMRLEWYKDYYYPNSQSGRSLWYHDHAEGVTAINAYSGQAGPYILRDPAEDALGLPGTYGVDDMPLLLSSKFYHPNGTLRWIDDDNGVWGDVIQVNGQPWPYVNVEPKKYRLRIFDGAITRAFALYLKKDSPNQSVSTFWNDKSADDNLMIPMTVIASDSGLLSEPVNSSTLKLSPGERYEVIVDFAQYAGQNLTLRNMRNIPMTPDYAETDKVMRFVVSETKVPDNTTVPSQLRTIPTLLDKAVIDHSFVFERDRERDEWTINGAVFSDARNRVLARVPLGTIEKWEFTNGYNGQLHPVHLHLIDFRIVNRETGVLHRDRGNLPGGPFGSGLGSINDTAVSWNSDMAKLAPYETAGLKDVVWMGPDECVTVEAHYGPWDGTYMFHCHNLVHEDNEMMDVFNVTLFNELGYPEAMLADPLDPRWLAQPIAADVFDHQNIRRKIIDMAIALPYLPQASQTASDGGNGGTTSTATLYEESGGL